MDYTENAETFIQRIEWFTGEFGKPITYLSERCVQCLEDKEGNEISKICCLPLPEIINFNGFKFEYLGLPICESCATAKDVDKIRANVVDYIEGDHIGAIVI